MDMEIQLSQSGFIRCMVVFQSMRFDDLTEPAPLARLKVVVELFSCVFC